MKDRGEENLVTWLRTVSSPWVRGWGRRSSLALSIAKSLTHLPVGCPRSPLSISFVTYCLPDFILFILFSVMERSSLNHFIYMYVSGCILQFFFLKLQLFTLHNCILLYIIPYSFKIYLYFWEFCFALSIDRLVFIFHASWLSRYFCLVLPESSTLLEAD